MVVAIKLPLKAPNVRTELILKDTNAVSISSGEWDRTTPVTPKASPSPDNSTIIVGKLAPACNSVLQSFQRSAIRLLENG